MADQNIVGNYSSIYTGEQIDNAVTRVRQLDTELASYIKDAEYSKMKKNYTDGLPVVNGGTGVKNFTNPQGLIYNDNNIGSLASLACKAGVLFCESEDKTPQFGMITAGMWTPKAIMELSAVGNPWGEYYTLGGLVFVVFNYSFKRRTLQDDTPMKIEISGLPFPVGGGDIYGAARCVCNNVSGQVEPDAIMSYTHNSISADGIVAAKGGNNFVFQGYTSSLNGQFPCYYGHVSDTNNAIFNVSGSFFYASHDASHPLPGVYTLSK